jgi:hypothetical protein
MNKKTLSFITVLSIIIGLCSFSLIMLFDGSIEGNVLETFLYPYWVFTIIGIIVYTFNYEKMICSDDFFINPLNLFLPLVNIFILLIICILATEKDTNSNNKRKIFKKDNDKMAKKYPQLNSLNALKEIFDLITTASNVNDKNISEKSLSTKKLIELIIFLENNYQKDEYSKLLIDYEITFVKLVSIYNESINTHIVILDEILISSKELLNQFSSKVIEIQANIKENGLTEKEHKIKLETEFREKSKERLLKEIDDEIQFHKNK